MPERLVTIATYPDSTEAYTIKGLLESNGVSSYIQDENATSLLPHYKFAGGGIRLQVADSDASKARTILAGGFVGGERALPEAQPPDPDEAAEDGLGEPLDQWGEGPLPDCPQCGSSNVERNRMALVLALVCLILILPLLLWKRPRLACLQCGHKWT